MISVKKKKKKVHIVQVALIQEHKICCQYIAIYKQNFFQLHFASSILRASQDIQEERLITARATETTFSM